MDRSDVITLIKETNVKNKYGVYEATTQSREIFCQVRSVTRTEFFEAGRNGINPEYQFTVFADDYEGEKTVVYRGKAYGVYRTYQSRTDTLELYVERKGGTNGNS